MGGFGGRNRIAAFQPEILVDIAAAGSGQGGVFAAVFEAIHRAVLLQGWHGLARDEGGHTHFFIRRIDGDGNT